MLSTIISLSLSSTLASTSQNAPVTQNPDNSYSIDLAIPGGNIFISFGLDTDGSLTDVSVSGAPANTKLKSTEEGIKLLINNKKR